MSGSWEDELDSVGNRGDDPSAGNGKIMLCWEN